MSGDGRGYSSPFGRTCFALATLGYNCIPVRPFDKAPGKYSGGQWWPMWDWTRYKDVRPEQFILNLWAGWPGANIGAVLGTKINSLNELIAVDFDTDDLSVRSLMESALPIANVQKRGRRGYTAFYQAPIGTPGRKFHRDKSVVCEILTGNATRQTLIPPSVHPISGQPYVWQTPGTLETIRPQDLVALDESDLERFVDTLEHVCGLRVEEGSAPGRRGVIGLSDDIAPHQALNALALTSLDAWVPALSLYRCERKSDRYAAVADWRPSSTGRPLDKRKQNLSIHPSGIKDWGASPPNDNYSALDLVMTARNWPLDDAFKWLSDRLGVTEEGFGQVEPQMPQTAVSEAVNADVNAPLTQAVNGHTHSLHIDPETGEVFDDAKGLPPRPKSFVDEHTELPDVLTRVPGLLGELTDWIADTSRRPNRVLALGAAITVLGTLIGRRTAGPTLSGTHLYVVALAPSGAGKDHPLRQIMSLMKGANSEQLIGPDEIMSMTAIIKLLERKPLSVCPIDEIGAFFKRLSHHRASPHEKSVMKVLRASWGCSFQDMMTPEWGSKESKKIYFPALSIFGVSTPGEFFDALQGGDVVNGFLNRFLLFSTSVRTKDQDPKKDALAIPKDFADRLARVYQVAHQTSPQDISSSIGSELAPRVIPWADQYARDAFEALKNDVESIREDESREPYFARTVEMALRLATIRAFGNSPDGVARISCLDLAWAREIAMWSAQSMFRNASSYIADNETQGMSNKVLRIIVSKGGSLSHRDLLRTLQGGIKSRDLADIVKNLIEAGMLVQEQKRPDGAGRHSTVYKFIPQ